MDLKSVKQMGQFKMHLPDGKPKTHLPGGKTQTHLLGGNLKTHLPGEKIQNTFTRREIQNAFTRRETGDGFICSCDMFCIRFPMLNQRKERGKNSDNLDKIVSKTEETS